MFSALEIEHSFLFKILIIIRNATLHSTQIYKMHKTIMLKMKILKSDIYSNALIFMLHWGSQMSIKEMECFIVTS